MLKNTALFNTVDLTIYNSHNSTKHTGKDSLMSIANEVGLDSSSNFYLTNSDLNFSKYFFNNVTLQKNRILIYSNLE